MVLPENVYQCKETEEVKLKWRTAAVCAKITTGVNRKSRSKIKAIVILLLVILIESKSHNVYGQDIKNQTCWFTRHPVDFSVGNFSVGMPFSKIFINKFYPLATVGTEFYYRNKKHSQLYQTARFGGYYTKYSTSALFLNSEIGYRYTFGFGLFADVNLGVGYSQLFRPNAIYKLHNGEYEQVSDWGTPSLMANYSMSIGYDFTKQRLKPVSVFLRYGNYLQLFYNDPDIPILPQNSFQVGARFLFSQKQKSNEAK